MFKKGKIFFVSILFLLFIVRISIPYINYIFLPLIIFGSVYLVFSCKRKDYVFFIKNYIEFFSIVFICFIILLLEFFLSSIKNMYLLKEILHASSVFVIFTIMIYVLKSKKDFQLFFNYFIKQVIIVSAIVSVFGLIKLFYQLSGITFDFLDIAGYPVGSSLVKDSNFYSLFMFFGIFSIFYVIKNDITKLSSSLYQILLLLFSVNIIFSTSRRGLILFIVLLLAVLIIWVLSFIIKSRILINFRTNTVQFLISLSIISLTIIYLLFYIPAINKNRYILNSGFNKSLVFYLNTLVHKTETIFNKDASYVKVNEKLWKDKFDPRYPQSGWGVGDYVLVEKLEGKNVEIVPAESMGYKLNRLCNTLASNNEAYSITKVFEGDLNSNNNFCASVYCFISDDFNGDWVRISSHGSLTCAINGHYDLSKKGEWQYLQTFFSGDSGTYDVKLYINKKGVEDFKKLQGYVIFAYPTIELIDSMHCNPKHTEFINIQHDDNLGLIRNLYSNYFINNSFKKKNENSEFKFDSKLKNQNKLHIASVFPNSFGWISFGNEFNKFNHKDSSSQKSSLNNKIIIKDQFSGPRLERYYYAIDIYVNDYSVIQRLFGGGFIYTHSYALKFSTDYDQFDYDYPHNPFLSVLLYSGAIGLMIYFVVLGRVFYLYWLYRKEYLPLFLCFIATFFYSFFSSNNPFDPAVMGLFLVLPFFIHYIHEKDKSGVEKQGFKSRVQSLLIKVINFRHNN